MKLRHPRDLALAFTLIELLIVLALLSILTALVLPKFASAQDTGRVQAMAAVVHNVREQIQYHANAKDVLLSADGWPVQIEASWFQPAKLPDHTWTELPLVVEVVSAAGQDYPATKSFDPDAVGAKNAWLNTKNGAFCILIGDGPNVLDSFNEVNQSTLTALNQTTK